MGNGNISAWSILPKFKAPDQEHKLTYQLEARDCRYIVEGEGASARYCCAQTPVDSSWCTYHRMVISGRGTESERNAIKALERSAR